MELVIEMVHITAYRSEIENILSPFREELGGHFQRYKNHAIRVFHLTCLMYSGDLKRKDLETLAIASAFHGLSVWMEEDNEPWEAQMIPLIEFMANREQLHRVNEISQFIGKQNKTLQIQGPSARLRELFRRAYWTDITKGNRTYGISRSTYERILKKFPSRGFHWLMFTRTHNLADTDTRIHPGSMR